jgi:hypothetical protein
MTIFFFSKVEVKKDPTGYHYKKVAWNIYQELFTTKLYEKLWPSNGSPNENATSKNHNNNHNTLEMNRALLNFSFSEGFFEKLAIMEFEASIYNQLPASKILFYYYQQVVFNEIKLLKNKSPRTILVNPAEMGGEKKVDNDSLQIERLKTIHKKLSLTISDFGKAQKPLKK